MTDLFLLTKPPGSTRGELCFRLMEHSRDPVIFLAGDGVFHLLGASQIPAGRVIVCRDDALARGVPAGADACGQDAFYDQLVNEMMESADHAYAF